MIARIAGTVILSAIVFVVVTLLVGLGVLWATEGVFRGALIGVICGTAAVFTVGAVGIAVGRRSSDENERSRSGHDRCARYALAIGALEADPERAGEGSRSLPDPFNQQGKARLAPVGREVIFGSVTYYMAHSDEPDSPDGSAP